MATEPIERSHVKISQDSGYVRQISNSIGRMTAKLKTWAPLALVGPSSEREAALWCDDCGAHRSELPCC